MSHDACTDGNSQVLTVASLQRLKMDACIPAPIDGEMWSVIKFLSAQSIAQIKIHCTGLVLRVLNSNPGADQTDWGSFRCSPQPTREMLGWIHITTVHLTIIHIKIHKSQILRQ